VGNGKLKELWEKEGVEKKYESSSWAQSRSKIQKRRQLNDFERFKVLRLRKQVCLSPME
jgi:large subunit ribosomal protein L14e